VGNCLISRKPIGMKQGAKKAWNDCKKFPRAGRIAGISRLGRKLSPGFKDKPLSRMEVDCTVHNGGNGNRAFAFSAAKKMPGVRRAKD
jgi:hypothetical protein